MIIKSNLHKLITSETGKSMCFLQWQKNGASQMLNHSFCQVFKCKFQKYLEGKVGKVLHSCCCYLVAKSCVTLLQPRTVALQAPLCMGFPKQQYQSGLPFPSPEYLPNPGIKPMSPPLIGGCFTTEPPGEPNSCNYRYGNIPRNTVVSDEGRKKARLC